MRFEPEDYRHVRYLWDEGEAAALDPLDNLVYRSNRLGADQRITNTGGGNTSAKLVETDPLTGEDVSVLWVKGSGGDLRTARRENFASLYQDKLEGLDAVYQRHPHRGYKAPGEDAMVGLFGHCVFCLNPRAPSIDTPLHSMIPRKHVDHLHPNAVIAIASCKDQERLTREVWGGALAYVPWIRPGWEAAKLCAEAYAQNPGIRGVLLGQHGHTNWEDDSRDCYETSLWVIEQAARFLERHDRGERTFGGARCDSLPEAQREELLAAFLPVARGMMSSREKFIATVHADEATLRFVNSVDAPRLAELGTACPDHFLRTKIKPLHLDWDPAEADLEQLVDTLKAGLAAYRAYYREYYASCRREDSPPMRDPSPTVMLVPGVGLIGWGRNKSESRVTAEFYRGAIEVMRGAEAVSEYTALPPQEAFDIEYWALEEAKLRRMPAEKPLARDVVVVIGAGDGIGRAVARRVAREGAHVVCADLRGEAARATADELLAAGGEGIGVAGTGISGCGPAVGLAVDITDRDSVAAMLRQAVLAYGGIDKVVVTAGVFLAPGQSGMDEDAMFDTSFAVNVKGAYVVASEAGKIWRDQKLPGALVLTTSVNAVVAKQGSVAYDTSKAAANHLVRELAVELAPHVNVNGLAPATVVQGSAMFPRERVIASLQKYAIPFTARASDDELRTLLGEFYARRTLLQQVILPEDQAEAAFLLLSGQLAKTTGQVLTVDGGLQDAFLR